MACKGFDAVFWDWNGTVLDDAPAACGAVNKMLGSRGLAPITLDAYRDMVEMPIMRFYEKVMDVSSETVVTVAAEFNPLCESLLPDDPIFPAVRDIFEYLHSSGVRQYIFSSSHIKYILPKLEKFSLSEYFDTVLAASDISVGSKIERTNTFIESRGMDKSRILFIGDLLHDLETATRVGSPCVLLATGHQSRDTLLSGGCTVLDNHTELLEYIKHSLSEV